MVESTLTAIGRVTKKAVIGAIKGTGEKAQAIVETTADLVNLPGIRREICGAPHLLDGVGGALPLAAENGKTGAATLMTLRTEERRPKLIQGFLAHHLSARSIFALSHRSAEAVNYFVIRYGP